MQPIEYAILAALAVCALYYALRRRRTGAAFERLDAERLQDARYEATRPEVLIDERSALRRWLVTAGFRSPRAPLAFVAATLATTLVGFALGWLISRSPLFLGAVADVHGIPGGVGEVFAVLVWVAPWLLAILLALLPTGLVAARRTRRVEAIERDLPITLELFATLAEAGLGIDAAMQRILASQGRTALVERPLISELRTFQRETLAGVPRALCFRRLAWRVDIPNVSTFVSAMIRSEQVGAGLARTLRQQAEDVWNRRRELALMRSQVLPVKMAFPLVICFLPALFVYTLGPAFQQFLELADNLTR